MARNVSVKADSVQRNINTFAPSVSALISGADELIKNGPYNDYGPMTFPLGADAGVYLNSCNEINMMLAKLRGLYMDATIAQMREPDTEWTKYLKRLSTMEKALMASKTKLMEAVNSKAVMEAARRNLVLPEWYANLTALAQYSSIRGYWTYAVTPESRIENPLFDLYYRVDILGANMFRIPEQAQVTSDMIRESNKDYTRQMLPNDSITDKQRELTKWSHAPQRRFDTGKLLTSLFKSDRSLWIGVRTELRGYGNFKRARWFIHSGSTWDINPPMNTHWTTDYENSPVRIAETIADGLGMYVKPKDYVKKAGRNRLLINNR